MSNPVMMARYAAVQSLLQNRISSFPITVGEVERAITAQGYSIINYDTNCKPHIEILEELGVLSLAKRTVALTYVSKSEKSVFIKCGISANDKRLLLAHELGHIVMGHMSDSIVRTYSPMGLIDEGQEDEANAFALEFLAPVCVLDKQHIKDVEKVKQKTLLDDNLAHAVADEVCKHSLFTSQELELCNRFGCKKRFNIIDRIKSMFKTGFILSDVK